VALQRQKPGILFLPIMVDNILAKIFFIGECGEYFENIIFICEPFCHTNEPRSWLSAECR
jgi:hypothetical protein